MVIPGALPRPRHRPSGCRRRGRDRECVAAFLDREVLERREIVARDPMTWAPAFLKSAIAVAEGVRFSGAAAGESLGEEIENDRALLELVGEMEFERLAADRAEGGEVGRLVADCKRGCGACSKCAMARVAAVTAERSLGIGDSLREPRIPRLVLKSEGCLAARKMREPLAPIGAAPAARRDVEEDHHRAGHKRQCHKAKTDQGRVNAGKVGEAGGDAHDLGVAPVDQETSVHSQVSVVGVQAIGSEVAAETNRARQEGTGEDGGGVTSRSKVGKHFIIPLIFFRTRPSGPCHDTMHGACQLRKVLVCQ